VSALPCIVGLACATPGPGGAQQEPELLVLAAASLTDALPEVARAWEAEGGAAVRFSFDATSRLAPQALQSAADLFFSADERWMQWLVDQGAVAAEDVRAVAGNRLVVVAPAGAANPAVPQDLAHVEILALAGENVPAGRYALEALEAAGLWQTVKARVVRAGSVRGALEWVATGEAQAGIVYSTDAAVEQSVRIAWTFPEGAHTPVRYPAAVLAGAPNAGAATAFLDFVLGPRGQAVFAARGFVSVEGEVQAAAPRGSTAGSTGGEGLAAPGPSVGSAVRISLLVAFLATLVGLLPALGLGWLLARHDFPGKSLHSTLVLAPLVMPPVVTGFLLLTFLGSRGLLGGWLDALGVTVPFTVLGAVLAALVVGLPLYVISVRGAFQAVDPAYEELSWTLGVPPRRTFLRISLPLALPGIVAGSVLAFARALGEFGATVVLAGNVEGSTRTIALAVYTLLESPQGREATWILVGASVAISLAALLGYEALSRRQRRRLEERHGR
jgi:molybdate transport system permease protein